MDSGQAKLILSTLLDHSQWTSRIESIVKICGQWSTGVTLKEEGSP